jgi:hypothetical protein
MNGKQSEGLRAGVGGEPPVIVITAREKRALKACNKLYEIIGEALEQSVITGLQFRLCRAALMLIENMIVRRFSVGSIEDAITEVNASVDIYNSFEDLPF